MKKFRSSTSITVLNYKKKNHANYYDYRFTDGTVHRLIVGEDNITQEDIDELIKMHNREVDHNCYHDKPHHSTEYKEQREQYEEVHYDNTIGDDWTMSYEVFLDSTDGNCNIDEFWIMFNAWRDMNEEPYGQILDLRAELEDLPEEDQELLRLRFYEDMSYRDIGDLYHISKDTAYNKIKRILKELRSKIE